MSNDWVALHVFYHSDANPIIVEAVRPLVASLREEGLITGWFFIKYWQEGPHIRVRLKPTLPGNRETVTTRAVVAIEEFLKRRPALYETDSEGLADLYKRMYLAEYGEDSWNEEYGEEGAMPFRPNNSIALMPYEPEYGRYGGVAGVELAEWHFERSSDMVAGLLTTSNTHVRPVLLGLATQLSLMTAYTFLRTDEKVANFFRRYRSFWETAYQESSESQHESFDKSLDLNRESFEGRVARIRSLTDQDGPLEASGIERTWLTHCRELRDRVAKTDFDFPAPMTDEELAAVLLSSYIHMTNNRLGAAILDEIYLSYLIERVLT
ncbi:thiopeptide-type bacteriocin biosynthesis protein [Herbidospora sp. RD11066]